MRAAPANSLNGRYAGWAWRLSLATAVGCGSAHSASPDSATDPVAECTVEAPTSCPAPAVRYADVAPLIANKCVSCHYGAAGGPWPLTTYEDAADWRDTIRDDVLDCSMPPPDSGVTLNENERSALLLWVRCGGIE